MKTIKYQEDGAENIIQGESHCDVDRDTADFLNGYLYLDLVYKEPAKEGRANMCKAMENYTKKTRIEGAIEVLQDMGMSAQQIAEVLMKKYLVSQEYVEGLMRSATA